MGLGAAISWIASKPKLPPPRFKPFSSSPAHHVISEVKAPCFRVLRDGRCSLPTLRNITKQICCCSRVGKAWGWACQHCPPFGSGETCLGTQGSAARGEIYQWGRSKGKGVGWALCPLPDLLLLLLLSCQRDSRTSVQLGPAITTLPLTSASTLASLARTPPGCRSPISMGGRGLRPRCLGQQQHQPLWVCLGGAHGLLSLNSWICLPPSLLT